MHCIALHCDGGSPVYYKGVVFWRLAWSKFVCDEMIPNELFYFILFKRNFERKKNEKKKAFIYIIGSVPTIITTDYIPKKATTFSIYFNNSLVVLNIDLIKRFKPWLPFMLCVPKDPFPSCTEQDRTHVTLGSDLI